MRHKLLLVLLALSLASTVHGGWFDNGERDRRIQLEHELQQQRQNSDGVVIVIGMLGIGGLMLFGIGAAIGSKARKAVSKDE